VLSRRVTGRFRPVRGGRQCLKRAVPFSIPSSDTVLPASLSVIAVGAVAPMDYCHVVNGPVLIKPKHHQGTSSRMPISRTTPLGQRGIEDGSSARNIGAVPAARANDAELRASCVLTGAPLKLPCSPSLVPVPSTSARQILRVEDLLHGGEKLVLRERLWQHEIIPLPGIFGRESAHHHGPHEGTHPANRDDEVVPVNFGHQHVSEQEVQAALDLLCDRYGLLRALGGVNPI